MEGYPQLAKLLATYPKLAIYRRFATLNARNLLYLQAELVDLEEQLDIYTTSDVNSDEEEKKIYSRNWDYLSRPNEEGVHNSQWNTILKIRKTLREYNRLNDSFTHYVVIRLIKFYHRVVGSRRTATDIENGAYEYKEVVSRAASIIGTLISSLLPILTVVALYCVKRMLVRLAMVALFTILFSLALVLVTKEKRVEVFAATAAFVSVQVVFVGSTSI